MSRKERNSHNVEINGVLHFACWVLYLCTHQISGDKVQQPVERFSVIQHAKPTPHLPQHACVVVAWVPKA